MNASIAAWMLLNVLHGSAPATEKPSVLVAGIAGKNGMSQDTADLLAEAVTSRLQGSGRFGRVLSRADMEAALTLEQTRQMMACDDTGCAAEIAAAAGTDYLAVGSVGRVGRFWLITLRLIEVRVARTVGSVSQQVQGTDEGDLMLALGGIVDNLLSQMDPAPAQPPAPGAPQPPAPVPVQPSAPAKAAQPVAASAEAPRPFGRYLAFLVLGTQPCVPLGLSACCFMFPLGFVAWALTLGGGSSDVAANQARLAANPLTTAVLILSWTLGALAFAAGSAGGLVSLLGWVGALALDGTTRPRVGVVDKVVTALLLALPGVTLALAPLLGVLGCATMIFNTNVPAADGTHLVWTTLGICTCLCACMSMPWALLQVSTGIARAAIHFTRGVPEDAPAELEPAG